MFLHTLCFAAASELNLNEFALTLQESLLKATDTDVSAPDLASSEQLQMALDLLLSLMPQSQSSRLEFDPPFSLDFEELAVAVPVSGSVSLVNRSDAPIRITSIALLDDKQFELSLSQTEFELMPQQSFEFQVSFFPNSLGLAINLVILNTSVGRFQYIIRAETTFNPYKLEPVLYDSLLTETAFAHRLVIYNPHSEPIEIKSVASTNDFFTPTLTDEDTSSWLVQPGHHQQFAILNLTTHLPGNFAGRLIVETNFGNLFVSVNLRILKSSLRFDHSVVKLGVLTDLSSSFNFDLFVTNLGRKGIAVHEIKSIRSSSNVKVVQTSQAVKYRERASLGKVSVFPSQDGAVSGSVLIYTNETAEPLEVLYHGEVDSELLQYNKDLLNFYPGNAKPRSIEFLNPKSSPLIIFKISTTSPDLKVESSISHSIGPKNSGYLKVSYTGLLETSKMLYIVMHSSFEEILIPVTIHNNILECYVNGQPCSKTLDLGSVIFEGSKVYSSPTVIELINSSPIDKIIRKIEVPQGIKAQINDVTSQTNVKIGSGEKLLIEVHYDTDTMLMKRNPVISIVTDQRKYSLDITYTAIKGSLKPSSLVFGLKSPSQSQSLVLQVTNRFPVAVSIKSVDYDTKVLDVILIKTVIKPNATVDLAKVTFGFNELKFKRRLNSLGTLTYEDISIYKELEDNWQLFASKIFNIHFKTDHPFNLDVPVMASVLRTPVPSMKRLDFGHIFVDSLSEKFVELRNNLDQPIAYKLYIGPNSIPQPSRASFCKNSVVPGLDDDEFEVSPQVRNEACRTFLQEEVQPVKMMSSLKSPIPRPEMMNWNLKGKLAGLIGDLLYFSQPLVYYNYEDSFFIDGEAEGVIAPKRSVIVGPLSFMPNILGSHNATLYVKNNHTFIEEVKLFGKSEASSIYVSSSSSSQASALQFVVSREEMLKQTEITSVMPKDLSFLFDITLTNSGRLPIIVKSVLLNGHSCSAIGISLSDCFEDVPLASGKSISTQLVYSPNSKQEGTTAALLVVTDRGLSEVKLEFKVDQALYNEPDFKSYKWYRWIKTEQLEAEIVVLIGMMLGYGIFLYLLFEDRRLACFIEKKAESHLTKALIERNAKEVESQKQPIEILEQSIESPEQPTESPKLKTHKKTVQLKKKVRVISFVPRLTVCVPLESSSGGSLDEAEAENKQLLLDSHQPVRCNSESKDSEASTCYYAGLTTPPSEEEAEEDWFIDTYKNNVLFEGPCEEIFSLDELRDN